MHAARLGAGAKVIASTALDAADLASKITTGVGMMDLAKSMASLSQEVLLTSGREILQDRLNKLKEILADSFFRSMSVTGIGMVVKSSIFGFKDSLEEESDRYAMAFIEQKQGSTDAYRRVMQRLYDEAVLDEIRAAAAGGEKVLRWFEMDVRDAAGDVVAKVRKQVYVRRKRRDARAGAAKV